MAMEQNTWMLPLFAKINSALAKGKVLLAIEGGSAAGKTTLAALLAQKYGCTVFHTDDFFLQPHQRTPQRLAEAGGNVDRERFLAQVLEPLSQGKSVRYHKFDCAKMALGAEIEAFPTPLTVVEGAYAMHPAFETYYNLSVFLEVDPQLQKNRILQRNGQEKAQRFFTEWIPLEQAYFEGTHAKERCNMVIKIQ